VNTTLVSNHLHDHQKMNASNLKQSRRQSTQEIQPQRDTTPLSTNISNESPLLQNILQKLRPFQLEAFDFATKGSTYNRQWGEGEASNNDSDGRNHKSHNKDRNKSKARPTTTTTNNNNYNNYNNSCRFEYDPALLGKGRILLADEMVRRPSL
jgi:hypothetical protein